MGSGSGSGMNFGGDSGTDLSFSGVPGAVGSAGGPGSGSPSWLSQNGTNLAQGLGGGLQQWGQQQQKTPANKGGGGGQSPIAQTPQLPTGFNPNYLLQFLSPQAGQNSSAFYGG